MSSAMTALSFPEELTCSLCAYLLDEAVMLPCCAASACEACARRALLQAAGVCPVEGCGAEGTDPDEVGESKAYMWDSVHWCFPE
jgi:hypothetical protein